MADDGGMEKAEADGTAGFRNTSRPEAIPGFNQSRLPARRSRISESGCSLTMLSPKTPQMDINYPEMFASLASSEEPTQGDLGALKTYGMYQSSMQETPYTSDSFMMAPTMHSQAVTSAAGAQQYHTYSRLPPSGARNVVRVADGAMVDANPAPEGGK